MERRRRRCWSAVSLGTSLNSDVWTKRTWNPLSRDGSPPSVESWKSWSMSVNGLSRSTTLRPDVWQMPSASVVACSISTAAERVFTIGLGRTVKLIVAAAAKHGGRSEGGK